AACRARSPCFERSRADSRASGIRAVHRVARREVNRFDGLGETPPSVLAIMRCRSSPWYGGLRRPLKADEMDGPDRKSLRLSRERCSSYVRFADSIKIKLP